MEQRADAAWQSLRCCGGREGRVRETADCGESRLLSVLLSLPVLLLHAQTDPLVWMRPPAAGGDRRALGQLRLASCQRPEEHAACPGSCLTRARSVQSTLQPPSLIRLTSQRGSRLLTSTWWLSTSALGMLDPGADGAAAVGLHGAGWRLQQAADFSPRMQDGKNMLMMSPLMMY